MPSLLFYLGHSTSGLPLVQKSTAYCANQFVLCAYGIQMTLHTERFHKIWTFESSLYTHWYASTYGILRSYQSKKIGTALVTLRKYRCAWGFCTVMQPDFSHSLPFVFKIGLHTCTKAQALCLRALHSVHSNGLW